MIKEKLLTEKTNVVQLLTSNRSLTKTKIAMSKIIITAENQDKKNETLFEAIDQP
jgi:hypothetical protein